MPQSDLVLFSVNDHVALITVNDPERRNAVTVYERAKDTELGPQATSIQSPEFAARLAAAKRR